MFESLSEKLTSVLDRLRGRGRLSEQDIDEALREIRLALLEADVHFKVVKDLVARIREQVKGTDVLESLTPGQTIVKIVYDELTVMLGGAESRLKFAPRNPTIVMLCGLQGSGKTTTCAKLGHWLRRQGRNAMLAACDVYRPAAVKQLQVLGEQLKMPVHTGAPGASPVAIARDAVALSGSVGADTVILDTAGRLHIDEAMMDELAQIKQAVNPTEILLVVDSMTGQDAVNFASQFHGLLTVDGFILTKMDSETRGGAALSIRSLTGLPIKFVGVGEKVDALDTFYPDRLAQQILGMGDVLSLIERAQESLDLEKAADLERKLKRSEFDLNDFLEQLQQVKKMGPLDQVLKMIPGMSRMKDLSIDESEVARQEAIVRSMTPAERADPSILSGSRKRRVAIGSGTSAQEVNKLLKGFESSRQMIGHMVRQGRTGKGNRGGRRFPA